MAAAPFVIFAGDTVWGVGTLTAGGGRADVTAVDATGDSDPAQTAARIAAALSAVGGYRGQGVVLALPSRWCCCAAIELAALPARNRREAMLYRLEGRLPDAAEDVCADFIVGDSSALGVCALAQSVAPLTDALEAAGAKVDSVCPAALLALQHLATGGRLKDLDALVWVDGPNADLFLLDSGKPANWYHVPAEVADVALRLSAAAAKKAGPLKVGVVAAPTPGFVAELAEASKADAVSVEGALPTRDAAVLGAQDVQAGKVEPWVELRRGPLAAPSASRRFGAPLAAALAAGLVLLICVDSALFWRATRYERLARIHLQEQEASFRRVFPLQEVPPDPQSRLASEYRRLQRVTGGGGEGRAGAPSALSLLHRVLTRLPRDVRFLVHDLRLGDGHVYMEGQARSHADAEAVAAGLREAGAFQVELPRTEQVPGTASVNFSLAATAAASSHPPTLAKGATP